MSGNLRAIGGNREVMGRGIGGCAAATKVSETRDVTVNHLACCRWCAVRCQRIDLPECSECDGLFDDMHRDFHRENAELFRRCWREAR